MFNNKNKPLRFIIHFVFFYVHSFVIQIILMTIRKKSQLLINKIIKNKRNWILT